MMALGRASCATLALASPKGAAFGSLPCGACPRPAGSALVIRPATIQDALRIAPLLRPEDVAEWIALAPLHGSPSIADSLKRGVEGGEAWYAEEASGAPVAIGGLADADVFASPWLMATPAVKRHGAALLREGRKSLRTWRECGLPLRNVVSAGHVAAVRFIKACGYEILHVFQARGERFFIFGVNIQGVGHV